MDFCPTTLSLLEEITSENALMFKSRKTGEIFKANPESTMLASKEEGEIYSVSKYRNTLNVSAYNPINPRERVKNGCRKCGRKIVSFQRLGENAKTFYTCICGNFWSR